MSSRQRGAWQEERHVTEQSGRVDKNTPAAVSSEQVVQRQRQKPLVCLYSSGQPPLSPSAGFTSVFPSWGTEGVQPQGITLCSPVSTLPSHRRQQGLVQVRPLCLPEAPYLSRQVMGSAAKPRHMLRAGHPGIQQLIGSSRGCQGLQQAAAGTTCPAVPGWRLRQRRGAALYMGREAGERGGGPSITPASSQPKAAQAAPLKRRA